MRIAVNTRFLLKGKLEGIGWYTYEIMKNMVEKHPDDEFFFLFDRPFDEKFLFEKNVTGIIVPPPARHPVLWYIWFEHTIPSVIKNLNADVFFSPDGYCSLKSDIPVLMTMHDLAYLHFPDQVAKLTQLYYKRFVPKFLKRANRIAVVSDFVKNDISKNLGIPENKIFRAYNGVRDEFVPINKEQKLSIRNKYSAGQEYFLYYGAIHPRKNILNLIAAFEKFKKSTGSSKKLLLAGRMAWKTSEIERKIKSSAYTGDIHHIDYLGAELPDVVAASFAVVYVSLFEGFGLPVAEAMQCSVPVITANVTSMPEVAGDAAICVDPANIDAIARAMSSLEYQQGLVKNLVIKGNERAKLFNWANASDTIYHELRNLCPK